ncbi:MAG TPA: hypothetical protein VD833_12265, partial [Vicinamibacterales bacterium]|nr:hypothetical protein [Vicinamibacterales bacterium]
TGMALAGYGASRRDAPGALLAAAGLGLLARAATNLEARRLTKTSRTPDEADIERKKTSVETGTREEQPGEVLR